MSEETEKTAERVAFDKLREERACDVCGNWPDDQGIIDHGRGCYTQSEDGGGSSFVELPDPPAN